MKNRIARAFLWSAGGILFVTAAVKLASAAGSARSLNAPDPILDLSLRNVFRFAGAIELAVAANSCVPSRFVFRTLSVAWLATLFAIYRLGLLWIHYAGPCPCLGSLTEGLPLPQWAADRLMRFALLYLLLGSYSIVLWTAIQKHQRKRGSTLQNNVSKVTETHA